MPVKEKFYSSLNSEKKSDKQYEHVLKVWNTFQMKTRKHYHKSYLKSDVLFSADAFK